MPELPEGSVPVSPKARGFADYPSYVRSLEATLVSCTKDRQSLIEISTSIDEVLKWIGGLPAGTRGMANLKGTQEGQGLISKLRELTNEKIGGFASRYKRDIVDSGGRLDTSKMGRGGQIGNALLIPVFARIYSVVKKLLENAGIPLVEEEPVPVEESVQAEPLTDEQIQDIVGGIGGIGGFEGQASADSITVLGSRWHRPGWITTGEKK
jgi:hypothetical protein